MISNVFISRPRLAAIVSIVLFIAGAISIFFMPVTQYPNVAPPTVNVTATYPGASAQAVSDAVAAPLEEAINGVQDMIYMSSVSTDAGTYNLTVTFAIGTDPDIAQVNVSNRVQLATSQLPTAVSRQGVQVRAQSPNFLLFMAFYSTDQDALTPIETGGYVASNVVPQLNRVNGVGNASPLGPSDYSMRIWTDPDKLAALNISTDEVASAIEQANAVASIGSIGSSPAPDGTAVTFTVTSEGRFSDAAQFEDIIVRAQPNGALVRLRDVARIELGAQNYSVNSFFAGNRPSQLVQVNLAPGANAISTVNAVTAELERLAEDFPEALDYAVIYDSTAYIRVTIEEIIFSLALVAAIVVAVVYVFLQDWRATLIPALAIPVSLTGTFAFLLAFGFTVNVITLLALILAIGLVVDDAILVVENCQRVMEDRRDSKLQERRQNGDGEIDESQIEVDRQAAVRQAMSEVGGPIISTTLVLLAVFIPVSFLPGLSGQLYRQFGVTLSISLVLSATVALTLTPALCATFLRLPGKSWWPLRMFSKFLAKATNGYVKVVGVLVRRVLLAIVLVGAALCLAFFSFTSLPAALVPDEDQGAILFDVSLPDGASLQRTTEVMQIVADIISDTDGVDAYSYAAGYSLLQQAQRPSAGIGVIGLAPWGERRDLFTILGQLSGQFSQIPAGRVAAFPPPPIPGIGSVGGFSFELLAQQGQDPQEMAQVVRSFVSAANGRQELTGVRSTFAADVPSIYLRIDTERAQALGLTTANIYDAIGSALGSTFVNQFNYQGRVYQVRLQADGAQRADIEDILDLYAKNSAGEQVPLRTVVRADTTFGPYTVPRFNLFLNATVQGSPAQGFSSGAALAALEQVAADTLPQGYGYQYSGTSYQQQQAGNVVYYAFALSFLFAYLFLVGLYESWLLPLPVMLSLFIAAAGAATTLLLLGYTSNIYSQIGIVMLIGLASKNAILIVEFARDRRREGMEITEAAELGARQRLRAVLMTALAFVIGIIPLATATGAGAAARNAIGVTAIGGMLAATFIGIFIVPPLYAFFQRLGEGRKGKFWGREELRGLEERPDRDDRSGGGSGPGEPTEDGNPQPSPAQ